jgi:hypothetical protein
VIAPHFFAVHAFVFLIFGPATRGGNQEHRMRSSVVEYEPGAEQRAGGRSCASAAEQHKEIKMRLLGKTAIVLGMVGAMAIGSMTASEARNGRNAAIAAGAGGFVAGAAIGAAAANANAGYYYGSGYGYDSYAYAPGYDSYAYQPAYSGYDSYAYEPAYAAPAPVYRSPSYYGPVTGGYGSYSYNSGYDTNYIGPWRERKLMGLD